MKQAQLKQPIVIITDPFIACWRFAMPLIWLLLLFLCVQNNSTAGPFINVMTIAPATVATVPNTLAWLRMLLIFNFSSLGRSIEFDRTKVSLSNPHVYGYLVYLATRFLKNHCKGVKTNFTYLRMQAMTKVMAGRIFVIAAAKVAVVYFIPRKYKFWSITGLPCQKEVIWES